MNKKNQTPKSPILVPKRAAGKVTQTDYMQNLRPFPLPHPVEDLLGTSLPDSTEESSIYLDDQNDLTLDDQKQKSGATKSHKIGRPTIRVLDDQLNNIGRPNANSLDDKTTKTEIWTTKEKGNLDDKTTKTENLDDQKIQEKPVWTKYERARSTARIGLRPNAEILRKIKVFCAENDLDVTEFFEISGMQFIDLVVQTKQSLGDKSPLDDRRLMITWKSKPDIINLYLDYNSKFGGKSKWSAKDDDAASKFNEIDIKIIELGLIQTQANKNYEGKINSFRYYIPEIENFIALNMPPESLNLMLEINRKRWAQATGKLVR